MPSKTPRTLAALVSAVVAVSLAVGLLVNAAAERWRSPLETARALARGGHYAEAERVYLGVWKQRPPSVPVLVELVENHQRRRLLEALRDLSPHGSPAASHPAPDSPTDESIVALLAAPDLPRDVALLGHFWANVTRGTLTSADRRPVVAAADANPPMPWSNHLLGREAQDTDRTDEAADRFAREATAFDERAEDADAACSDWIASGRWDRISAALTSARFARQVSDHVRFEEALARRDLWAIARWFLPAQYEGSTPGVLLLALVSGLVWFVICLQVGLVRERPRVRVPLYAAAFALGVASTYVALAFATIERALGFVEKRQAGADLIYFAVGVGLREELSKALLLLPLVPVLRRWGTRREAFACGALVGLGFAVEENIGYLQIGLETALARFLTANFLHLSTTGLVAVAIHDSARGREPGDLSRTLMLVVGAHGLYDFFLSSGSVESGSFLAMFVFVLLTRRFVNVLRELPGKEAPLLRSFIVGLALVAGSTFVYACTIVSPLQAAVALLEGGLGLVIVAYMFVQEFKSV